MNKAPSDFLRRALKPPYVALLTCLILFLTTTSQISKLERQAAPLIAELRGMVPRGYGIESFAKEYLADPFGKAMGLSQHQLQLCRQLAAFVPAYKTSLKWRNMALFGAFLALLFLSYQRFGSRWRMILHEWKKRLQIAATEAMNRKFMAAASERFSKMQRKSDPMKSAVVHIIVSCPSCRKELRVPTGKGRIRITCSACGNKFETTT